ncbi:MAG: hypothetical protein ABSB95_11790 [Dissulfurispiraceae bacterium]|jgi:hypothetical protein
MKKTASQLRADAKKLLEQAERIEQAEAIRIGKFVLQASEKGFKDFTIEHLRAAVSKSN